MNLKLVQYAFWAWCILLSGCTVWQNARRTTCDEPRAYSWKHDRRRSVEAYHQLADELWQEETHSCPELYGQPDYAMGFRDGFVDFVYAGGTGEPPPVPPRHFWNVALRAPNGKDRANQWFSGYRHGARIARDGGYRDLGIIHSSVFGLEAPPYAGNPSASHAIEPGHLSPDAFWTEEDFDPHMEILPEPQQMPSLSPAIQSDDERHDRNEGLEDAPFSESGLSGQDNSQQNESDADSMSERAQQDQQEQSTPDEPLEPNPLGGQVPVHDLGPSAAPHERTLPMPPGAAAHRRNRLDTNAASSTTAPEAAAARPETVSENSTLRFIAGVKDDAQAAKRPASAPSNLVQTSFVVKAPTHPTPTRRKNFAPAPTAISHPPGRSTASAQKSTIKIYHGVSTPTKARPLNTSAVGNSFVH